MVPPSAPHAPVAPQWLALVSGLRQTPPQLISVPGQDTEQTPLAQTFPLEHAIPALPPPTPHAPDAPQ
jgi:hypothetical protein